MNDIKRVTLYGWEPAIRDGDDTEVNVVEVALVERVVLIRESVENQVSHHRLMNDLTYHINNDYNNH